MQKEPSVPETSYYLGLIAQEENDDLQAVTLFTKSLQLLPSYADAHVAIGSSYLKLKDYPRAQTELELAVKLNPDDPKAHYQLAVLHARLKNPERAQEEMQIVERLKEEAKAQKKASRNPSP